ncbi:MAG TPA: bifunctional protein-serine/threonine kinase/phosphatase [Campylobacterales bacterium]|nr:bifunctional protein-serine/threonine kinase/phosphatase [Campylobacterales bacterium]HHH51290.1 bifunctional protein-serine/threonine kinase/phosphatase [Campylobacterales bacterium]
MTKHHIKTTSFSLAKGKQLTGDDYALVKSFDNLTVAVVCDGVGSATEGANAAKRTATQLVNNFKTKPNSWSIQKSIESFIISINSVLYQESILNYERPELVTTLTIVVIQGDRLYGANVGDSRVYLYRNQELTQLSQDHSMDEKGYENVLTQAIGMQESVAPYYFENRIQKSDYILLCSDGLYNDLEHQKISEHISLGAYSLVKTTSKLHNDNLMDDTTAITLEIIDIPLIETLKKQNLTISEKYSRGDIIDGYRLMKPLIQNNLTWLCEKKGMQYVIKFASYEALSDEVALDFYVTESWNATRLKAGFFPKAVIPKKRTHRYYIMEHLKGVNLKTSIKKRLLTTEDAIAMTKTILKAVQYLTRYDLVHGDIKPENIMMLDRKGKHHFKVIDFGSIVQLYATHSRAGTPSYLAPERFAGTAISESTEIFAIGVTLYEALTGRYPYGEIEPFQTPSFKLATFPSQYNKNIPHWLDSIIMRSIALKVEERYANYSEMLYEIDNPKKVIPFYDTSKPLMQRDPLKFFKIGFYIELYVLLGLFFWWFVH